jgi:hypothetical protein
MTLDNRVMKNQNNGFIKFNRNSEKYFKILEERPTAFLLLSLIANRARRTNEKDLSIDLEIGEALIGDYFAYNVTESVYRTDKKYLIKNGFIVTTRADRRGTIVKLIDSNIFDICPQISNQDPTNNKSIYISEEINNTKDNNFTSGNNTKDISLKVQLSFQINKQEDEK